jgi:hypothetical protein
MPGIADQFTQSAQDRLLRPGMTATNAFPRFCTSPAEPLPATLAFRGFWPQIKAGRLAVDEPLANRVRSGRKQP